ncbi:hypothetical protein CEXT_123951 [Caerostris extrusa]|uniref:Uncharacterized protein n=1 Tax=Caerostris extrusa TaxID=172846 RepID=A0AAV4RBF2_CAEEX|nr:hypothetical protein CEXT_123951 [Caerostris extrusa]
MRRSAESFAKREIWFANDIPDKRATKSPITARKMERTFFWTALFFMNAYQPPNLLSLLAFRRLSLKTLHPNHPDNPFALEIRLCAPSY